jgi:hypothetical protein
MFRILINKHTIRKAFRHATFSLQQLQQIDVLQFELVLEFLENKSIDHCKHCNSCDSLCDTLKLNVSLSPSPGINKTYFDSIGTYSKLAGPLLPG